MSEMKMVYTPCQGWGCHDHCMLSTFVNEDGVIDHTEHMILPEGIRDDQDPSSLAQRAWCCQKGILAGKIPYMKERLRYPMRRVGERGEGKFERITWDEAVDEISEKLAAIREKYGEASVLLNQFCCGLAGYPSPLSYAMSYRFLHTIGATEFEWEGIDESVMKGPDMVAGNCMLPMSVDCQRLSYADYVIIWGGNPIGYSRAGHTTNVMMKLKRNGVKFATVGVVYDSSAAKSEDYLEVKPASDGALAFAMAKYIIDSGQVDEKFLSEYTIAPFLVREDTGKLLRESDIVEGGDPAKYVFWDSVSDSPMSMAGTTHTFDGTEVEEGDLKAFMFKIETYAENDMGVESDAARIAGSKPDLDAVKAVSGITCETAYVKLKKRLAPYTFEYQETITGVPAAQAEHVIEEYCSHKNSTIWMGAGLRYLNSTAVARGILLIPMLTGRMHADSAGLIMEGMADGTMPGLNDADTVLGGIDIFRSHYALVQEVMESFKDPTKQQYKAFINLFSNPVHNWPPRKFWRDEFFPNMELIVVSEIRETETTKFADYVLPDLTVFERDGIYAEGEYLIWSDPAIEPVGEARDLAQVMIDIATRLGYGKYFEGLTLDDWHALRLQSSDPQITTVEPPITLERLKEEKLIKVNCSGDMLHPFRGQDIMTPSHRFEFYVEALSDLPNGAVADVDPALIDNPIQRKRYPLHLYVARSRFFMQGQFREIEELRKLAGSGPRLGMNKADAMARGLKEGDLVEVYNGKGVVKVPIHFTRITQPGMVLLWYAYGVDDYKMSEPATELGSYMNIGEACDPVSELWGDFMVARTQAMGAPETMVMQNGRIANETIWDALCEVRKAE